MVAGSGWISGGLSVVTYWSRLLHDPRCRYRRVRRRRGHRRSASPVRPPCTAWQCAEDPVPAESVSVPTAGRARRSSGPGSVREVVSHVQKLLLAYIGEMRGGDAEEKNRCGVEGPVHLGHVVVEHADDCFSQKRCRADEGGGSGPQHGGRHGRRQGQEGLATRTYPGVTMPGTVIATMNTRTSAVRPVAPRGRGSRSADRLTGRAHCFRLTPAQPEITFIDRGPLLSPRSMAPWPTCGDAFGSEDGPHGTSWR